MDITSYFKSGLFKGKTVFVTGGGSGINLGIAKNFAALGADIALCGRTQAKLDAAAAELRALGAKVCPVAADVRDFAALESAFARSRQELGPMDVLVSGAAGNFPVRAEKLSEGRSGRHAGGAARWLGGPATAEGSAPKPTGGPNSPSKPRGP
jgi:NAD(P)-dependent dehydrogenase (short-subunit alcohol dehydrogenase family)